MTAAAIGPNRPAVRRSKMHEGKGVVDMARNKDRVADAAENIKPYVERAMTDDKLRNDVMRAFGTARELYSELSGSERTPIQLASRVATDDDLRAKLTEAIEDLRHASERLQGRPVRGRGGRKGTVLVAGIALGILFNPLTGPETRRFIKDAVLGGHEPGGTVASVAHDATE
ncbi:unannotated protein [freshwater metagenome]|uniref:Unannotated protein n=1 Tax=freshwater metagenome TaxID=449393 RepID=A0A6J6NC45_9ZZZZ